MSYHDLELPQHPADASRAAELRELVILAKLSPRDEKAAAKKILALARDPEWAERATYWVENREHGDALLPSVWFARPAAHQFGHIHAWFVIGRTSERHEELEGVAFDAQTVSFERVPGQLSKFVKRKHPETGKQVWHELDEQELLAARNRLGAILVRRAILNLLPAKLVSRLMEQCERTLEKRDKAALLAGAEAVAAALVSAWSKHGVTRDDLEAHLGHTLLELTSTEHTRLGAMQRAVEQGAVSVASIFARAAAGEDVTSLPVATNGHAKEPEPEKPADPEPQARASTDWAPPPETSPVLDASFWNRTP